MKKILAIILVLSCVLPAVAKKRQNEEIITPLTQLEKRQFQTKTYDANDNLLAMKAILNVLQDDGFIVYNVNSLLGYIYAIKDFDMSDPNIDIPKEFGVTKSRLSYNGVKVATLEVGVNVTQYGDKSRIRANFKRKLLNEYGNAQMIEDIEEPAFYDNFYTKIDSAILLQKQFSEKTKKETQIKEEKVSPKTKIPATSMKPVPKQDDSMSLDDLQSGQKPDIKDVENSKEQNIIKSENIEYSKDAPKLPEEVKQACPEEEIYVKDGAENVKSDKEQAKELKELLKQAKEETKQAEKEAKQLEKEIKKTLKQKAKEETE